MRDLNIAYGNSVSAKTWSNKTITFDELKDKLRTTIRTVESVEEYAKFSRAKKTVAKVWPYPTGDVISNRSIAPPVSRELFPELPNLRLYRPVL